MDLELYDFVREKSDQCDIYTHDKGDVEAFLFVNFNNLEDFIGVYGEHNFDEGAIDAHLCNGYVVVDIVDQFEDGTDIYEHRRMFTNWDYMSKNQIESIKSWNL